MSTIRPALRDAAWDSMPLLLQRADVWLAGGATLVLGIGMVVLLGAAAAGSPMMAAAAGVVVATALVTLVAAGWLNGLAVVALAVPLPALLSTADIRIATAAPVSALVIAAWLLGSGAPRASRRVRPVQIATVALLAGFALSVVAAASWLTSLRELSNIIVLLGFFLLALGHARDARTTDVVITIVVVTATACGVLAVLEMVGVLPGQFPRWGTPYHRAALGFGQPNGLGLFLAVSLPLCVHALRAHRGVARAAAAAALLAPSAGLFATFSRGSWLAVLFGAGALVFVGDTRLLRRFFIGLILFGLIVEIASGGMISDTAQRTLTDWVIEQRAALMLAGVMMFLANPLTGVGAGGFAVELDAYGAQIPALWDYLPTPHNAYVQMAAETGVIGLVAFIAFLVVCFVQLVRRAREAARAGATEHELSLRHCLLWSFATACCAGMVVWPLAHGTGQAMLLLLAVGLAREAG